jgi:hypothetical protein
MDGLREIERESGWIRLRCRKSNMWCEYINEIEEESHE